MSATLTARPPYAVRFSFDGVQKCQILDITPHAIQLVKLEIAPEMQGRGIGTRVLRELKRLGKSITLVAYPDDPNRYEDCRRFYRRNGFVEDEGTGNFVWTP